MATIKLKGELHPELLTLGLKAGDIIRNTTCSPTNQAVYFDVYHVITVKCVVYPENYEIIEQSPLEEITGK